MGLVFLMGVRLDQVSVIWTVSSFVRGGGWFKKKDYLFLFIFAPNAAPRNCCSLSSF